MLWVFYGKDFNKAERKLKLFSNALQKKRPDAEFFTLDPYTFTTQQLEEYIVGQGLFERKVIVILRKVFESKEAREVILERIKDLQKSSNAFILFEESFTKKEVDMLSMYVESIECFDSTMREKKEFGSFALADSLGKKDKLSLWIEYIQALQRDASPEELHGLLFWQIKSMILSKGAGTHTESGLKQFIYTKSKKFAQNYTQEELQSISHDLICLYHNARRGEGDLKMLLEQWILKL